MSNRENQVSVVIPNWNGSQLLRKHLPKVVAVCAGCEIIVVDDASDDDSVELLRSHFPGVRLIQSDRRGGFAQTVNLGVAAATGDIVLLVNSDVEPENNFLPPLLRHFSDERVFAVGCLEKSHEKEHIVLRGRGEAEWRHGFFVHRRGEVDRGDTAWVSGGSGAFRKDLWIQFGGMDSLYSPFYWEDIDLSYTARKSGYKLAFEPKSVIHHYHEEGKIKQEFSESTVKRIAYRNQFIFIWKNLSDINILLAHLVWTPIRLTVSLLTGDALMLSGYLSALGKIPQVIGSRRRVSSRWRLSDREISGKL